MAFEPFLAYEASAGSGKTFNLVVRYLSLLFMGESPSSIVALTFTNKAANEMLERVIQTLEELPTRGELDAIARVCGQSREEVLSCRDDVLRRFLRADIQISTIDRFFGRILRKFALNAGLMPTFRTVQNHHEPKLMERFLNEVEVSRSARGLVHLSILSDKRLADLFALLSSLYSKHKELDLDAFDAVKLPADAAERAMELAAELSGLVCSKPLSDRARKTMQIESFEALLEKTWLSKPTLEYWDFKKIYEPRMDELLHALQEAVASQMRRREVLYFRELFALLKLYAKSRQTMAAQSGELSFDDITLAVHTLLRGQIESEFLYFRLDSRIKHLLLDEFQDTSVLQFDILRPLIDEIRAGQGVNEGGSFFFVGDVKQSIYRFRGGVSALFHRVADLYDVKVEPLRTNYRSRSEIVGFVNRSFGGRIRGYVPQMARETYAGGYVDVTLCDDPLDALSERIGRLVGMGIAPEKIAVLTVTNRDGSAVEERLGREGHEVVTETTARLVAQRSVRAIIEYLRYAYFAEAIYRCNCAALIGVDNGEIERAPLEDFRGAAISFVRRHGIADKSALMFIEALEGYRDIEEVVFEIDRLDTPSPQSDLEGIRIMTVHKSKGLEFDHVVVVDQLGRGRSASDPIVFEYDGVELMGLHYRIKGREALDERYARALDAEKTASDEDRLNALYVALTRAAESLWIVAKEKGSWFEPLELLPASYGTFVPVDEPPAMVAPLERVRYRGLRFGRQEETLREEKGAAYDYAAVQFGLALHYTLEMMGRFTRDSLGAALESARNRYGAVLPAGAVEEIGRRVERLIGDETFRELTQGEWRKEQPLRYRGGISVIDLLVRKGDEWIVIDYKTGRQDEASHREQVHRYVDAVGTLGGGKCSGYLCYLLQEGIEWVKCL